MRTKLRTFSNRDFDRGAPKWKEALWLLVQFFLVRSWLPGSRHRRVLLRWFGAIVGDRVVIKSGLRVKFPWRLEIANDVWLGQDVWIDNLATVSIESDVCISQGVYLCTGSHDWRLSTFPLITRPIIVESGAWIGAHSCVASGVRVGTQAILALGSVATRDLRPGWISQGNPAIPIKLRS